MTNSSSAKGARAERECAAILSDLLGVACLRKLGAGRKEDTGDIFGLADCVVQVGTSPSNPLRYVWEKPIAAELQRHNAGVTFAASFIWLPRRGFRVVQTPAQFATLYREATA